ncbi:hypothetical protein BKH43_01535 [Helicobacter sp. 13S00401-1]|nr:hypothetical protein BKH43_01535 [Helicobacter sp. 13S00401-1]
MVQKAKTSKQKCKSAIFQGNLHFQGNFFFEEADAFKEAYTFAVLQKVREGITPFFLLKENI